MPTLHTSPARRVSGRPSETPATPSPASARKVREMLLEIAYVLHTTRVVRRAGDFEAKGE